MPTGLYQRKPPRQHWHHKYGDAGLCACGRKQGSPPNYFRGNKGRDPEKMSAAERLASSQRMKRIWQERRNEMSEKVARGMYDESVREKLRILNRRPRRSPSLTARQRLSDAHAGKMPANNDRPGKFGNVARGWFDINGKRMFFRSKWEANYALYLDFLVRNRQIVAWEYEPKRFIFEKIQLGTRSYCPDFRISNLNRTEEYHEVKGWMTPKSATQIKRMAKYFPQTKLIVIDGKSYADIKRKLGNALDFF